MKTLIFVRHGEAGYEAASDYKRELTSVGKLQAENTATFLLGQSLIPEVVMCSSAARTMETCDIICRKLDFGIDKIQPFLKFYSKGFETYIDEIIALEDTIECAMIVGHNPAVSQLVNYFCKDELLHMKPGSMVAVAFDLKNWNSIFSASSEIVIKNFH